MSKHKLLERTKNVEINHGGKQSLSTMPPAKLETDKQNKETILLLCAKHKNNAKWMMHLNTKLKLWNCYKKI